MKKTSDYQTIRLSDGAGFTLIEALISVAIISIIGLIIAALLSRTFQSNAKTQLLGVIKQNGQAALSSMDQNIRNAQSVVCVGDHTAAAPSALVDGQTYLGDALVIKTRQNIFTRYLILKPLAGDNGFIYMDFPTLPDDKLNNAYGLCSTAIYPDSTIGTGRLSLIDTNTATGLRITASKPSGFTLSKNVNGAGDLVQILFYLSPNPNLPSRIENSINTDNSESFQTSVSLRD